MNLGRGGVRMDYATLGLAPAASAADIKRAYYKLALKFHPDRNPAGADEFRRVNDAYTRLADCPRPDPSLDTYLRELFGDPLVDFVLHLGVRDTIHLSPTLDDLSKVFLYKRDACTYPIPLWHHELAYDTFDVVCTPQGITLDSDNNVHVTLVASLAEVFAAGEIKSPRIPASELRVVPRQTLRRPGAGIPRINETAPLDDSILSDLVLDIYLTR